VPSAIPRTARGRGRERRRNATTRKIASLGAIPYRADFDAAPIPTIDHVDPIDSSSGTDLAQRRVMQTSLLHSVLFVALASGCAGTGQLTVTGEATAPDLVVVSPGVQVIADLDEPIFYSGNYYWRNQGGSWYRSTSHTHGWARVEVAPVEIRTIERPSAYIHYHGEARARVSGDRQAHAPMVEVRDHREVVAPAPRRDDKHDKDDRHDKDDKDDKDDRHDRHDRHDKGDKHHD
jgi:hypothetical protein